MGTRSLTVVSDHTGEVCVLYRQFDGYPSGHGTELAQFLAPKGKPIPVVNGLSGKECFNGPHCFAAQLVAHFKKEPGSFYLYPPASRDLGEEYIYFLHINEPGKPITVRVIDGDTELFRGTAKKFFAWAQKQSL